VPDISVVISTLNGATGLERCLRALARQTIADATEVVVVDDGSTDNSIAVATAHGARVVRHGNNAGLAAARNSGVLAANAPIVAFTDDDCEPERGWAEQLLGAHGPGVIGVGGEVVPEGAGFIGRYLKRHNPLGAREIEVAHSQTAAYRLRLYLRHLWLQDKRDGLRPVHSLCGASMSFPRDLLLESGLFDTRFTFGAEELDLCMRLAQLRPTGSFIYQPEARVVHHFTSSPRDTLKRARGYGRGDARIFRKWPSSPLSVFPYPFVFLALLALGSRRRATLPFALVSPMLMFPAGVRDAVKTGSAECLLDPFIQLAQEAGWNVGFADGAWRYRHLEADAPPSDAPGVPIAPTRVLMEVS
jgi:GT2 family glycosyltransferase